MFAVMLLPRLVRLYPVRQIQMPIAQDCDYTYTYTDCANLASTWTYTYTLLHSTHPAELVALH